METRSIYMAPVRIFGMAFFALVSFLVLLFLFSLFFAAAGLGVGAMLAKRNIADFAMSEESDYAYISGNRSSDNLILEVPVEGIIFGSPSWNMGIPASWGGVTYGYEIQDMLKDAAKEDRIKAVLLHMQTPGGTIYGSMAISDGIREFREQTQKPVFVYIEGLSASGGVMSMVGADAIFADHGSLIGSIGVLGARWTYFDKPMAIDGGLFGGGIATEGGIQHIVVSAGRSKDLGNPFRKPTEAELKTLQTGTDNAYANFVDHVASHRNMEPDTIRNDMGAQIFDNKTAETYGLIDGTRTFSQILAEITEATRIGEDYQLVREKGTPKKFWQELLWSLSGKPDRTAAIEKTVKRDLCRSVSGMPLAYFGDIASVCRSCEDAPLP